MKNMIIKSDFPTSESLNFHYGQHEAFKEVYGQLTKW